MFQWAWTEKVSNILLGKKFWKFFAIPVTPQQTLLFPSCLEMAVYIKNSIYSSICCEL